MRLLACLIVAPQRATMSQQSSLTQSAHSVRQVLTAYSGTHDALDALCVGIDSRKVSWILDADIQSFFDTVNQEWLIRFVEHRIGDRRIIRLIRKWLKAGVLEDGIVTVSDRGTGQGAVISPL